MISTPGKADDISAHFQPPHQADNLLGMLVDSSIDQLMSIDMDWIISTWNKAAEISSGMNRKDLLGKHLLEAFPGFSDDTAFTDGIMHAMLGRKVFLAADRKFPHRNFSEHHIIPLRKASGLQTGVMILVHDVSHRIKAEQQLEYLNQVVEKKYRELELASGELSTYTIITSTKVKDPVRHIYTGLEFLVKSEGRNLSDEARATIRRMQSSLNRVNLLLNDILDFSRISNLSTVPVHIDTRSLMNDAMEKLANKIEETGAQITMSGSWPSIQGYPRLVETLFMQITDNALKFQPAGQVPMLTVSVSGSDTPQRPGATDLNKQYVSFSFADNGIGFPLQAIPRIYSLFEKLNDNQYRGSGMGLALARKIMEIHDGYITTESTPGQGSVFHCFFPVVD